MFSVIRFRPTEKIQFKVTDQLHELKPKETYARDTTTTLVFSESDISDSTSQTRVMQPYVQ